jgi:hypothetical protein
MGYSWERLHPSIGLVILAKLTIGGQSAAFLRLNHSGKPESGGWHSAPVGGLTALPCASGFCKLEAA